MGARHLPRSRRASSTRAAAGSCARWRADGWLEHAVGEPLDVRTLCLARETLAYHDGAGRLRVRHAGARVRPDLAVRHRRAARALPARRSPRARRSRRFALSEPDAGSDVAAMTTTRRRRPPDRHEDLDLQRRDRRLLHRLRARARGHQRVRRRGRRRRGRRAHRRDRAAPAGDAASSTTRPASRSGRPAQGMKIALGHARRLPLDGRRGRARVRAPRARRGARARARTRAVRRADGRAPARAGQARRRWRSASTPARCSSTARRGRRTPAAGASRARRRWPSCTPPRPRSRSIDAAVQLFGALGVTSGHLGRAALPRDPRAADLRGRVRGPAADHRPGGAAMTDTFARDHLPPREAWPDLLLLDGPARVNAAVELLAHEGTAIAGGWSYAELRERARRGRGVAGDRAGHARAAALARTRREAIAAWLGILLAGGIVVATMPLLRAGEIAKVVDEGAASTRRARRRATSRARSRARRTCALALEDLPGARRLRARRHGRRRRRDHRLHLRARPARRRAACTSTATCWRAATRSRARCSTRARPTSSAARRRSRSRSGSAGSCCSRCASARPRRRSRGPATCSTTLRERGVTTLFTAPTAYRALLARGRAGLAAHVRVGGRAAARRASRTPGSRRPASGSSTGSARPRCCTSSSPRRPPRRGPARAGGRCPGYEARIVGDGHGDAAAGRGRASWRCAGRPAAATSTTSASRVYVRDGWNLTGDAFSMDADGYFWFQARTDDMIISSGYNISRLRGRGRAARAPAGRRVRGRRGARRRARARRDGVRRGAASRSSARELQDHVKALIAPYKYPRRIEFVDALPRTPDGQGPAQRAAGAGVVRRLQPPGWPEPRGYANGIEACGRLVFVGGQIGWDETGAFASDDLAGAGRPGAARTSSPCSPRPAPGPSTSRA